MRESNLHILPRFSDSLTFIYIEHVRIEKENGAIVFYDAKGKINVPIANLSTLMLGPGTSVTHAAITACAENGCSLLFCGENGVRFYAGGFGDTKKSTNLMQQAKIWADPKTHLKAVIDMYKVRFEEKLSDELTLEQIRGKEGVRVRDIYAKLSKETGIKWTGRVYRNQEWNNIDPVNKALSIANNCLYGLCHAAILSIGCSPGLGFVHTGNALSFVYDIADLYKAEITIPLAFKCASQSEPGMNYESFVRRNCRDYFRKSKLIERIIPDIQNILKCVKYKVEFVDLSESPNRLWDGDKELEGHTNYGAT